MHGCFFCYSGLLAYTKTKKKNRTDHARLGVPWVYFRASNKVRASVGVIRTVIVLGRTGDSPTAHHLFELTVQSQGDGLAIPELSAQRAEVAAPSTVQKVRYALTRVITLT